MKSIYFLSVMFLLLVTSCYKNKREILYPDNNCDTTNVGFTSTIQPVMSKFCATSGCHEGAAAAAGIDLTNYSGVKIIADNGRLIGSINHSSGYSPMPKNASKLSSCDINKITAWINKGAQNN